MRKRMRFLVLGIFLLSFCGFFTNVASLGAKEIVLKAVSAWPANDRMSTAPLFYLQARVNKELKGKVRIEFLGGPEVVPSFELIEAVRSGMVDIGTLSCSYYMRVVPEVGVLNLSQFDHKGLRQSGFYDAFNQVHQKKLNTFYYGWTNGAGIKYAVYLRRKIEKPDFSGLKFRASPIYVPFIKALGAAPVILPPPEIYTALERGVIDGICWPNMGITDWGWDEVLKYMVDHEVLSPDQVVIFNLDTWKKLPEEVRKHLLEIAPAYEEKCAQHHIKLRAEYRKLYKASGLEFIKFSPEDARRFESTVYEATKKEYLKKCPETGPGLLKLLTK
jgi:TRAP-type C4-dicarboxylate transport system substrate-binding protein